MGFQEDPSFGRSGDNPRYIVRITSKWDTRLGRHPVCLVRRERRDDRFGQQSYKQSEIPGFDSFNNRGTYNFLSGRDWNRY
jgi:hypothetical protein